MILQEQGCPGARGSCFIPRGHLSPGRLGAKHCHTPATSQRTHWDRPSRNPQGWRGPYGPTWQQTRAQEAPRADSRAGRADPELPVLSGAVGEGQQEAARGAHAAQEEAPTPRPV